MNEAMEAEIFNRELTALLSGEASGQGRYETVSRDLDFARRLLDSDLSAESRVRTRLKALWTPPKKRSFHMPRISFSWFALPGVRPSVLAAACAALAVTLVGPQVVRWYFDRAPFGIPAALTEGYGDKDYNAFGRGSSPYETAGGGLSPGSSLTSPQYVETSDVAELRKRVQALEESLAVSQRELAQAKAELESLREQKRAPPVVTEEGRRASQQHYLSGVVYFQKGDYVKARDEWGLALQLDPENEDARAGLARLDRIEKGEQWSR